MTDILQLLWLVALTGYLWYRHRRSVVASRKLRDVGRRHQRIDTLKARRADLEGVLTRMQSSNPEERIAAAREVLRRRAAART